MNIKEHIEAGRNTRRKAARHARGLLRTRGWSLTDKIAYYASPEPNTGCFLWTGQINGDGYGTLWWKGRMQRAHRLAWEAENGPLPAGMQALHRCDTPCCVSVAHLFAGTQIENIEDMVAKRRNRNGRGER